MCSRLPVDLVAKSGLETWFSGSTTWSKIPFVFMDFMSVIPARPRTAKTEPWPLLLITVSLAPSTVPGTQWSSQHLIELRLILGMDVCCLFLSMSVASPSSLLPTIYEGVSVKFHTYTENTWSQFHWHWTCSGAVCVWPHSSGVETGWCAPWVQTNSPGPRIHSG